MAVLKLKLNQVATNVCKIAVLYILIRFLDVFDVVMHVVKVL